jgi:exopolysaccharide biosynthesis polyprenyl glycosylphosphotransferase
MSVLPRALGLRYRFAKRVFDVLMSAVALVVLLPVILVIAIIVRLTSPGPVFYRSVRVGLGGREFYFLKFRSMYVDAEERLQELLRHNEKDGPIFKMKDDPRITPVGRLLRKFSLDELPQFLHVLTGEMSMVGPRPPIPREVACYDERARKRLTVKPGITCYWQIMGRSQLSFEEWVTLDLKYIEDMNFWVDLLLLVKTPYAVFFAHGAY